MVDVHCHILPGVDDGSRSVAMSLEMIKCSAAQGVGAIVFTPHFYADMDSPETFLARRNNAYATLLKALHEHPIPDCPGFALGSEVHFFRGISRSNAPEKLCFGNSGYVLIEMPFRAWQPQMISEIEEISKVLGLRVIIAHIERYLDQDKKLVRRLIDNPDLIIQSNGEFFTQKSTSRLALKMLKAGQIDLLGSDCHNLDSRRPNLSEAFDIIDNKLGSRYTDRLIRNGRAVFEEVTDV